MQRAIRTAYLVAIRDLSLCCYSSPPSPDGGSWLNVIRLRVRMRGDPAECMSMREICASRRGHHYVEA
jgi:hypothetical protein